MSTVAIRQLDLLLTMDPTTGDGPLGRVQRAAVVCDGDRVVYAGPDAGAPAADQELDGAGCIGLPGLVDCHTHAVWAGSRAVEFGERLAGASYTEILERGGGILSTVRATRAASFDTLVDLAARRLERRLGLGITTTEIKSGYGLNAPAEVAMLRAARAAGERAGVRVLTTFLGAHAIPAEHRADRDVYVLDVVDRQLPAAAPHADFIDAYIDRGAFTVDEGRAILGAGKAAGLGVRVHAEQVAYTGAAALAAELGALSADHLERVDAAGAAAMGAAGTIATLLPGAMLYLKDTAPPVAMLRDAGVRFAVATDLNPGSSPVHDLWTCATLACVTMGLTVDEALRGITAVAADALGLSRAGRLRPGDHGDVVVVAPAPGEPADPAVLIQHLGGPEVRAVVRGGARVR